MSETLIIDARNEHQTLHKETAIPRRNWRQEMVKRALGTLQHVSPRKTADIVWHYFTQPGKPKFTEPQKQLIERAEVFTSQYHGLTINHYRWGTPGNPKILLCHGWRSKAADFRRLINALVEAGYVVEAMDMNAHGNSAGMHSALPEFRDILKDHYVNEGPFEAIIGHSLGGLAAGIVASELAPVFQPKSLLLLSFPPYVSYFFRDIIKSLGFRDEVFDEMSKLVGKNYDQPAAYFDLRKKQTHLKNIQLHFIYDEDDQTVPFEKGMELFDSFPDAQFVHTKGLGHYRVMTNPEAITYIVKNVSNHSKELPKIS